MNEFVFLFRASDEAQQQAMGTPEQARASMQAWMAWVGKLQASGNLKDRGQPLDRAGRVVRGSAAGAITDGPFVETKDIILGFMIVKAPDLAAAVELSRGCPMLPAGAVEVRPVASLAL
jgi:hypothetical protein